MMVEPAGEIGLGVTECWELGYDDHHDGVTRTLGQFLDYFGIGGADRNHDDMSARELYAFYRDGQADAADGWNSETLTYDSGAT